MEVFPSDEKGRATERERESTTAGKLRQSIRSPGPKELVLGFVELLRYFLPGTREARV